MVYYFSTEHDGYEITLYIGKNKEENEDLIKYGLECDVWFHVDNLSSAHVYLRLPETWTWADIPDNILEQAAQLTKANSIKGNKIDNVTVIYTPWSNLHKSGDMVAGQVGFHHQNQVKRVHVKERINTIINRLMKTREEKLAPELDLQKEKLDYERKKTRETQDQLRQRKKEEKELARQRKQLAYQRDHIYDDVFKEDATRHSNNQFRADDWEDDFM